MVNGCSVHVWVVSDTNMAFTSSLIVCKQLKCTTCTFAVATNIGPHPVMFLLGAHAICKVMVNTFYLHNNTVNVFENSDTFT